MADTVTAIASVWAAVGIWAVAWLLVRAARDARIVRIEMSTSDVRRDVDTGNEGTVGSFASDDETRRIEVIDRADRTPTEQRHLDGAPLKEAPQGPDA